MIQEVSLGKNVVIASPVACFEFRTRWVLVRRRGLGFGCQLVVGELFDPWHVSCSLERTPSPALYDVWTIKKYGKLSHEG